jgi:hypothetical protein
VCVVCIYGESRGSEYKEVMHRYEAQMGLPLWFADGPEGRINTMQRKQGTPQVYMYSSNSRQPEVTEKLG